MICLITGLPGSGKTLFTLDRVNRIAERDKRDVYYLGIKDLLLPWIPLDDPTKWMDLPPNSIVVMDEAQKVFRLRPSAGAVPPHVAAFETHRHLGIDVYLITQHPTLIDTHIRRLSDSHFHLVRKFNLHWSTAHEFYEVRDNPDKFRNGSVPTQFRFPPEIFKLYTSAALHTVKRKVPARVIFALAAPLIVVFAIYFAYQGMVGRSKEKALEVEKSEKGEKGKSKTVSADARSSDGRTPKMTRAEFLDLHEPIIKGLSYTAPMYAEVTKATVAPAPVACVASSKSCSCFTDQATVLQDVPEDLCRLIVKHGFFHYWKKESNSPVARDGGERMRAHNPATQTGDLVASAESITSADVATLPPQRMRGVERSTSAGVPLAPAMPQQPMQKAAP